MFFWGFIVYKTFCIERKIAKASLTGSSAPDDSLKPQCGSSSLSEPQEHGFHILFPGSHSGPHFLTLKELLYCPLLSHKKT